MEAKSERIISVDFLRGLTVAFMIFVNSPGSWDYVLPWFAHAKWNGCTPTDLIFPFFLFIVGLSVHFSLSPLKSKGITSLVFLKITKRTVLLFLIGLFINGFPYYHLDTLRIPGVLQRIAIVFFICAMMFLYISMRLQILLTLLLLLGYWLIMCAVPVPTIGVSNLEPATNMAAWVDSQVLRDHVWAQTKPWDPEGVLSTLPAIASGLIGLLTGFLMKSTDDKKVKTVRLFLLANLLVLGGMAWGQLFPVNKNLWTSSYVLFTSGIALHGLAISYWILDVSEYRKFTKPVIAFGANAISAYILSELTEAILNVITLSSGDSVKSWLFHHGFASWLNPYIASHVMAFTFVCLMYIPIWMLYKKKITIKI